MERMAVQYPDCMLLSSKLLKMLKPFSEEALKLLYLFVEQLHLSKNLLYELVFLERLLEWWKDRFSVTLP